MAERRLDNRRRIEATRRVAFPSNRKPPIHREIGIGGSLATPPLPHHRTYGSVSGGSAD